MTDHRIHGDTGEWEVMPDAQRLPLGLHLIGRELDEQGVLNAALAIEERAGFTAKAERWW